MLSSILIGSLLFFLFRDWLDHYNHFNQLTSVFYASVLLLIINFVITLSKIVAVDPRGDSRVDPQSTFDNVMTKFVNNRKDTLKTDVN